MLHSTMTLPRGLACEAINVLLNKAEEQLRGSNSEAGDRALVRVYGIHDGVSRFADGCADWQALLEDVSRSIPTVTSGGDVAGALVRDVLVAVLALLEVSQ
jgi:hypothetical protein